MTKNTRTAAVDHDGKSPFVNVGKRVFRPIFPIEYSEAFNSGTNHPSHVHVSVTPSKVGPLCTVGDEVWFSHGYTNETKKAFDCWKPTEYLTWK